MTWPARKDSLLMSPPNCAKDLQYAIAATGKSLSTIVAESLEDWMNKQGYRRPGT